MVLEDAGETNAGFGSNLTESGTVEMDAGLMDGSSLLFGSVGAISGKVTNANVKTMGTFSSLSWNF